MYRSVLLLLFFLTAAPKAPAASIFRLATDQGVYNPLPGVSVNVSIFLDEQFTDASILVAENGLFSAAIRVDRLPTLPTQPASIIDIVGGPEFSEQPLRSLLPPSLILSNLPSDTLGPIGTLVSPGLRRVLLGVFTISAGSIAGESTSFRVTDLNPSPSSQDFLTYTGTELDPLIAPAEFSVTVVPESAAPLFLTLAWVQALQVRTRRRPGADLPGRVCAPVSSRVRASRGTW